MNIAEILKDCFRGTKLYSPIYGELSLVDVRIGKLYPIFCRITRNGNTVSYTEDGKSYTRDAEPTLFFSKEKRDWSEFNAQENKPQFKPFDKVLVRDIDEQLWECNLFSRISEAGYYVCVRSRWAQCIPYKGNEHLLGTTNNPE